MFGDGILLSQHSIHPKGVQWGSAVGFVQSSQVLQHQTQYTISVTLYFDSHFRHSTT